MCGDECVGDVGCVCVVVGLDYVVVDVDGVWVECFEIEYCV